MFVRIFKIARTISDLDASLTVEKNISLKRFNIVRWIEAGGEAKEAYSVERKLRSKKETKKLYFSAKLYFSPVEPEAQRKNDTGQSLLYLDEV